MQEFDYNRIQDPRFFAEGRLPANADYAYAAADGTACRLSLDGVWKFAYAQNYAACDTLFSTAAADCHAWADIKVPGHIQLQGYDVPQYVNSQYPWDGRQALATGQMPQEFNPVASYVKYFTVPAAWQGMPVYVCFEGAESGLAVWCNGAYVGYSEDSFTPHAFCLTPHLTAGENKLAVQVFKWTTGSWCEDQDFFRFSGLHRSVYLYTTPRVHIADMKIETPLADGFLSGSVEVALTATACGSVHAQLALAGETVAQADAVMADTAHLRLPVTAPQLWSAEQPTLYDLTLTVSDENGVQTETVHQKVGMRRIEIKNSILWLNGKRIVFRGVNRHEFCATGGRCVSKEDTLKDVLTMKRNNINAIRTSHYPNSSYLYQLCDEYGLYLIDECNMETHGTWQMVQAGMQDAAQILPGSREEWRDAMLDRANAMVQRDKNHPSVLLWSCGNESYGGKVIFEMAQLMRRLDATRPVHYEGVVSDRSYPATSDVESQMYTSVADVKAFLAKHRDKPFILCEYAHAMGNSCGALYKYTELADTEPLYQGGFIWDYIDQSLTKTDRYGKPFQAYGGDFGERPTDYNFSGNGIVYGEQRDASPKMAEVKYCYQAITADIVGTKVTVVNKNLFTNTDVYTCEATLAKNGEPVQTVPMAVAVPPVCKADYPLPFVLPMEAGEYTVTVRFTLAADTPWAPKGHEVAFGQAVYNVAQHAAPCTLPFEVIPGTFNIGVRGADFDVLFSGLAGGLVSYRYKGREMIAAMPKPNFWRAPTDNDNGNQMPMRYAQWKAASLYLSHHHPDGRTVAVPEIAPQANCLSVTFTYFMPTVPLTQCKLQYKVYGDGTVETTLHYTPEQALGDMPEFGVLFKLDADYDRIKWYGLGPDETYADRCRGAKLGIYQSTAAQCMAKYLVPQECGNHMGVRWAEVTNADGAGLRFTGSCINFSALPYTPHEVENAAHAHELPPVHTTVVRVAAGQMGIAGDDTWGARTHPEFLLDVTRPMAFTFSFKGI